jgi:nucleotide-binding universal stress UspA family protein
MKKKETSMYQHILLPTDGSELSNKAIPQGIELAKSIGARVTGIHVSATFHTLSIDPLLVTDRADDYEADARTIGQEYLAVIEFAALAAGVPYEGVHVLHDHPYEAILDEAKQRGCDLIVMASHGRRGVAALVLGSETHKVLTHGTIPTLVYR